MSEGIGMGTPVGVMSAVLGTARYVSGVDVVMELMGTDLSETILLVPDASATNVGPLLAEASGIVCTSGGPTSHLALVAREFGLPCVVAATIDPSLAELDRRRIEVTPDGRIALARA